MSGPLPRVLPPRRVRWRRKRRHDSGNIGQVLIARRAEGRYRRLNFNPTPAMHATAATLPAAPQTRRTFLKATAAAATVATVARLPDALAAGQVPSTGVAGANDRIVVGYVGTGSQGQSHLDSQKKFAAENNIAQGAVCDLYQKRLRQAQQKAGLPDRDAYDDYRRLLERRDIDAITVATVDH